MTLGSEMIIDPNADFRCRSSLLAAGVVLPGVSPKAPTQARRAAPRPRPSLRTNTGISVGSAGVAEGLDEGENGGGLEPGHRASFLGGAHRGTVKLLRFTSSRRLSEFNEMPPLLGSPAGAAAAGEPRASARSAEVAPALGPPLLVGGSNSNLPSPAGSSFVLPPGSVPPSPGAGANPAWAAAAGNLGPQLPPGHAVPHLMATRNIPFTLSQACQDKCCWRWLAEMLLQEARVVRSQIASAKETVVEMKRMTSKLQVKVAQEGGQEVLDEAQKEHEDLKGSHDDMAAEIHRLVDRNEKLGEEMQQHKQASKDLAAEILRLEQELVLAAERIGTVEARRAVADTELQRLRTGAPERASVLQESDAQLAKKKYEMEAAATEIESLKQRLFLTKVRGHKKRRKSVGSVRQ